MDITHSFQKSGQTITLKVQIKAEGAEISSLLIPNMGQSPKTTACYTSHDET